MNVDELWWTLMNFGELWWMLMNFDEFRWIVMHFDEFRWIVMNFAVCISDGASGVVVDGEASFCMKMNDSWTANEGSLMIILLNNDSSAHLHHSVPWPAARSMNRSMINRSMVNRSTNRSINRSMDLWPIDFWRDVSLTYCLRLPIAGRFALKSMNFVFNVMRFVWEMMRKWWDKCCISIICRSVRRACCATSTTAASRTWLCQ